MTVVFFANGFSQVFFIAFIIVLDSMLSDTIDEHELETGKREEGLFFAARALAQKASYGLGSFFAGIGLDIIAFPTGIDPASVDSDAIWKLALLAGPVSVAVFLFTAQLIRPYPLTAQRHTEIIEAIKNKQDSVRG
jgi:Na+/melibiose symporter-like transporter